MANSLTTQVLVDGPRNVTIKVNAIIDTSDVAAGTVLADPALLSNVDEFKSKAKSLRIDRMDYVIKDGISANLSWDGAPSFPILELAGRGNIDSKRYGGLQNNAAFPTGKITMSTTGFTTGNTYTITFIIDLVKQ